ncbi:colicin immunity protein Cui [Serratia rubidaea]|uniref:colicin immunity protein Cui n=1 Tax=Serratia rubidaea TaxID=61652 RepID=UPI002DBC7DA8|nr:colicin immunity protein Cui [Serratia rubidaea]MEB7587808.1 colicin immunity protein Cui [Serratia rubidaea]
MEKNALAWKRFFVFLIIGLLPFFAIFATYIINPDIFYSGFLFEATHSADVNISSNNVFLSQVLGMYCRVALPLAIAFVVFYGKYISLSKSDVSFSHYLVRLFLFGAFCAIYTYVTAFCRLDLVNGNRLLKNIASNDYLTLSYYLAIFSGIYIFISLLLLLVLKLPEAYKKASTTHSS